MSEPTFEGLKAKLEHDAEPPNYHGRQIEDAKSCTPDCPRCYAERLEKRVEELESKYKQTPENHPLREMWKNFAAEVRALLGTGAPMGEGK